MVNTTAGEQLGLGKMSQLAGIKQSHAEMNLLFEIDINNVLYHYLSLYHYLGHLYITQYQSLQVRRQRHQQQQHHSSTM
jgi:hypothetical protein